MRWTVKYFSYRSDIWRKCNATAIVKHDNGAAAYAARQQAIWTGLADKADKQFKHIHPLYNRII